MAVAHRWLVWPALLVIAIAGCDKGRPTSRGGTVGTNGTDQPGCTRCHGGADNQTGAPPVSVRGLRDRSTPGVGAHTAHVMVGPLAGALDCSECHPDPRLGSTQHMDSRVEVLFGARATTGGAAAAFDASQATCSNVYCHGAFRNGRADNVPGWTAAPLADACGTCHALPTPAPHPAVPSERAGCAGCHPSTVDPRGGIVPASQGGTHVDGRFDLAGHRPEWMDPKSIGFHALAANRGLTTCQGCHGVDLGGSALAPSCGQCHGPDWKTTCTMCHGGLENLTGAPPKATFGQAADLVRVGAHSTHVTAGRLSPGYGCELCHVKPADALSPGHIDGQTASVAFTGLATAAGAAAQWDRAGAGTCTTYCHGATLAGGSNTHPLWTGGAAEAACGTCHGLPPPAPHPPVGSALTGCTSCHPDSVDAAGNVKAVPAGKHLDGQIQGQGHDPTWMDVTSAGFHAFSADAGLASCQVCHGADLTGGSAGVGCGKCHDASLPSGVTSWARNCVMCHGGTDNQTGAPPRTSWGRSGELVRVGAHTSHLGAGYGCADCHVTPADAFAPGHLDGPTATVTFGALASTGTVASWNRGGPTCTTYCHGATLSGGTNSLPSWTAIGVGEAGCGTCHGLPPPAPHPVINGGRTTCNACHPQSVDPAGNTLAARAGGQHLVGRVQFTGGHDAAWKDPTSAGFHAFAADRSLTGCTSCHGATLDGGLAVACSQCHGQNLPAGVTRWQQNCVMCHGGRENQTGAPPKAIWGQAGDPARGGGTLDAVRVGAHTAHVSAGALTTGFDCAVCHAKPADALSIGHIDGPIATVAFAGLGAAGGVSGAFTRASATCTTYCHGATLSGGSNTQPVWTATGQGQAACGTCHGVPPPSPHPAVLAGVTGCAACHPDSVDAAGNVKPPPLGKHLDGQLQGQGHDPSWMDRASAGFHAFAADANLLGCTGCHGAALDGGSAGVACAQCHDASLPAGVASWRQNCVMCHGGVDNQTGAPPRAIWGQAGDPARGGGSLDAIRVGAHTAHVAGSAFAPAIGCEVCHVKPADALTPGHVAGATATVTFGGLAVGGNTAASFTRTGATCITYCHGATLTGGSNARPVWTATGQGQAACGTCHGIPPPAPHPAVGSAVTGCVTCHPDSVDASGQVKPLPLGKHLDGQLQASGGHDPSWMDTRSAGFHAFAADRSLAGCTSCHGTQLDGGSTGVACAQCHDANLPVGVPSWRRNCVMCHGGTDNATGAPPMTIWGQAGDPNRGGGTLDQVRIGAHTRHVTAGGLSPGYGCTLCHVKPNDALAQGHADGATATVTFAGLAATGTTGTWDRATATCSAYCHGATLKGGTNAAPRWTGGSSQATCGTCHGLPPPAPHPQLGAHPATTACALCHADSVDAAGNAKPAPAGNHLDGLVQATGGHTASWMDQASPGFHAFSANTGLGSCTSCHGAALDGGPVGLGCAACHDQNLPAGVTSWTRNCVMCHGGTDNATGAPPRATWGRSGAELALRVGAHSAHVGGGPIAAPFACEVCHVRPVDAFSAGHIDGSNAAVTFGGLAAGSPTIGLPQPPAWTRATATCASTYCHGGYTGTYTYTKWDYVLDAGSPVTVSFAGKNAGAVWTPGAMTCGSCHDNPPRTGAWHSGAHRGGNQCQLCHPDAVGTDAGVGTGISDPTLHVNGNLDLAPRWDPTCFGCH